MSNNLIVAPSGQLAARAAAYVAQHADELDELGAGVTSGFAVVSYKGKVWSVKHRGEAKVLLRPDDGTPVSYIDAVIVKAPLNISKIFYESGFVDGSNSAPDCWSTNGVTPDSGASKKQANMCAGCPKNAWGSKVTDAGKQGKACADSKRLAIVPGSDLDNEAFGGPMLLRVPAASLKDMAAYSDQMKGLNYPYFAIVTRISFDPKEAYPKFTFKGVRALTDEEFSKVEALRGDPRVSKILSEAIEHATADVADPNAARQAALNQAFLQPPAAQAVAQNGPVPTQTVQASVAPPAATADPVATTAAPPAASPAPVATTVAQPAVTIAPVVTAGPVPSPATPEVGVPGSFDDLLEGLLKV